jgi:hypothetical protein
MSHTTVALATPFFVQVGLLARADRGRFTPAAEVKEFATAYQFTPDVASHRLGPLLRKSWFAQVIIPKVAVLNRDHGEILGDLATAAGTSAEHAAQLSLLVDFAVAAGIVGREGTQITKARARAEEPSSAPAAEQDSVRPESAGVGSTRPGVNSGFINDSDAGLVKFHIDVHVNMADFATWRPERISAFFQGIAAVLAAKGRMEGDSTQD